MFPTCKQSERGAYRSNNKLLRINDHVAAEHNSTSLISGTYGSNRQPCPTLLYKIRIWQVLFHLTCKYVYYVVGMACRYKINWHKLTHLLILVYLRSNYHKFSWYEMENIIAYMSFKSILVTKIDQTLLLLSSRKNPEKLF